MATLGHFIKDFTEKILTRSNLRIFQIIERVRMFSELLNLTERAATVKDSQSQLARSKPMRVDHTRYLLLEQRSSDRTFNLEIMITAEQRLF